MTACEQWHPNGVAPGWAVGVPGAWAEVPGACDCLAAAPGSFGVPLVDAVGVLSTKKARWIELAGWATFHDTRGARDWQHVKR